MASASAQSPRAPLGTFACYDGVLPGKQALQIFTRRGLKLAPNWDAFGAPALHITRQRASKGCIICAALALHGLMYEN